MRHFRQLEAACRSLCVDNLIKPIHRPADVVNPVNISKILTDVLRCEFPHTLPPAVTHTPDTQAYFARLFDGAKVTPCGRLCDAFSIGLRLHDRVDNFFF